MRIRWTLGVAAAAAAALAGSVSAHAATTDYPNAVKADNPVSYWRANEASGTLADAEGAATLSVGGSPLYGLGGAIASDPTSTAIGTSSAGWFGHGGSYPAGWPTGTAARAVELWFKTTATANGVMVSWGSTATGQAFDLGIWTGGTQILLTDYGDSIAWTPATPPNDGTWHHVVVSGSGNTYEAYLDGVDLGSKTFASASVNTGSGSGIQLGHATDNSLPYTGSLDEVAVYGAGLSAARVAAHYAAAQSTAAPGGGGGSSSGTGSTGTPNPGTWTNACPTGSSDVDAECAALAERLEGIYALLNATDGLPVHDRSPAAQAVTESGGALSVDVQNPTTTVAVSNLPDVQHVNVDNPLSLTCDASAPCQMNDTATLSTDDQHRLDLMWWGVWACVGCALFSVFGPPLWRAYGFEGKLGRG